MGGGAGGQLEARRRSAGGLPAPTMGLVTRGEVPTRMVALLPEELEADPEANLDLDENLE